MQAPVLPRPRPQPPPVCAAAPDVGVAGRSSRIAGLALKKNKDASCSHAAADRFHAGAFSPSPERIAAKRGRAPAPLRGDGNFAARASVKVGAAAAASANIPIPAPSGPDPATTESSSGEQRLLEAIKWDGNGLVVAIAQHVDTGAVLMQGFADRDAISATLTSRRATFFSRSRSCLWTKGETSSNFIHVVDMYVDCDRDSIIYLGSPDGPTCHTGAETCYYTPALDLGGGESQALTTLYSLEATIARRKAEEVPRPSWTKKLLRNPALLCSKIREEADELCRTMEDGEGRERSASEMADLLYHSLVLLSAQDVKVKDVLEVLRNRFSLSGIEEKKSRPSKS